MLYVNAKRRCWKVSRDLDESTVQRQRVTMTHSVTVRASCDGRSGRIKEQPTNHTLSIPPVFLDGLF